MNELRYLLLFCKYRNMGHYSFLRFKKSRNSHGTDKIFTHTSYGFQINGFYFKKLSKVGLCSNQLVWLKFCPARVQCRKSVTIIAFLVDQTQVDKVANMNISLPTCKKCIIQPLAIFGIFAKYQIVYPICLHLTAI